MNNQSTPSERLSTPERNALQFIIAFIVAGIISFILTLYFGITSHTWQITTLSIILFVSTTINLVISPLIRKGNHIQAMWIVGVNIAIVILGINFLIQGLGLFTALAALVLIVGISSFAMSARYVIPGIALGILLGLMAFFLDSSLSYERLAASQQILAFAPYIMSGLAIFVIIVMVRQFNRYSLQVKITLGILGTGILIIISQTALGAGQVGQILSALTQRYEQEGRARIEDNLTATVKSEAEIANSLFDEIRSDLILLADLRANLEKNKATLSQGAYWDAATKVYQLSGGQYGNSPADPSSVFIPSIMPFNEAVIADLNTTAYLDFSASAFLATHPEVIALYYISKIGTSTYYPNINLAQNGPGPDFNAQGEAFYTIAEPQNNPERAVKWTDIYVDPAKQGLVVTVSSPVYEGDAFLGVISADIKLDKISEQIANIHPGKTGFAFLVDAGGRILVMPPQGYELYNLQPEVLKENETPHQSILAKGSSDLQSITAKIVTGESGIASVQRNGEPNFIVFTPLKTSNYRLVIVAPEAEFTAEITAANKATEATMQNINSGGIYIIIGLFIVALLISLWVGQLITRPLVKLTRTVDTISAGDLSARAVVATQDETGKLATAFNNMTEILSDTLANLEKRISERTSELEIANKNNEQRALQFESVARIAQVIGSTEVSSDDLLSKVVETISQQFNFYHVGVYLLDLRKEYAILTASNSEGGKRLINRQHRVPVNESSLVGFAAKSGKVRVALNTDKDATYSTNPELSLTQSEITLPLTVGSEIIGVLDVQSREKNAFDREDINLMTTLARQVSIAIQNARSYQQTREALQRAENASIELSRQSWRQFAGQKTIDAITFNGVDAKTAPQNGKKPDAYDLTIPLTIRGTRIGSIKLNSLDSKRSWSEDELALLQAAADRTSLAIENARLLQEAQKRAAKEKTIGEITSKISGLVNLENIIETTIKELGSNLSSADVSIQFMQEDAEQSD